MSGGDFVELVDEHGRAVGTMEKLRAHEPPGVLHRAISVMVVDEAGRMLLQKRASSKYHFAGLWANTCCSHPRPGEAVADAGRRRLLEEMGIEARPASVGSFVYRAVDPVGGLVEHELDHVLVAEWSGEPRPNKAEAEGWRWVDADDLAAELVESPVKFCPWLVHVLRVMREAGLDAAAGVR